MITDVAIEVFHNKSGALIRSTERHFGYISLSQKIEVSVDQLKSVIDPICMDYQSGVGLSYRKLTGTDSYIKFIFSLDGPIRVEFFEDYTVKQLIIINLNGDNKPLRQFLLEIKKNLKDREITAIHDKYNG